ncbi:hypothetical protein LUZ60_004478 [Juncus effusus]|nr:hypothetical protein LUZ60_004478 [Juncus effusus]
MFFSQALLGKKGPMADIWMAAYYFKKLKKKQVAEISIPSSVDQIMKEIQQIAYRILAHLLLGLVKIFSKKVDFLQQDCEEARRIVTESLRAVYWTNPQKSAKRKHKDIAEPSDLNRGPGSIESLRAQCERDGFSLPDRFELDLFDLEIEEESDEPDTHQLRAHLDNTVDERARDMFIQETCQRKYDRFGDFDLGCSTPIQDIIPVEMILDLDLDINEFYATNSSKKEKHNLNQEANNNISVDQESTHREAEETLNLEPRQKEKNNLSQEANNTTYVDQESTHREAEETLDLEPGQKEKNLPSKDKNTALNLKRLETEQEPLQTDPGWVSPKLSVQTPVKRESARKSKHKIRTSQKEPIVSNERESARKSRKRKICTIDQEQIIRNDTMRETIHDANDLVYRRRKASQTNLDIWREKCLKSDEQLFTDPLIPCTFSKIQSLFLSRVSEYNYNTPQKHKRTRTEQEEDQSGPHDKSADISNSSEKKKRSRSETERDAQNDKSADISDSSRKTKRPRIESETERDVQNDKSADAQNDKSADISDSVHERSLSEGTNLGFGSLSEGPAPSFIDRDLGLHEGDSSEEQPEQGSSSSIWSVRTRLVAQHIRDKFAELKKSNNKENCLSLENILEGKRRKSCARFFYETLTLKGRGLIDVKQETPYGDIKISETPQFEEQFREN